MILKEQFFLGDCLPVLEDRVPNGSVDLLFVDPPYNIGKQFRSFKDSWPSQDDYLDWLFIRLAECFKKLGPTGSAYIMGSTEAMPHIDIFVQKYLLVRSRIVWAYDSSGVQAKNFYGSLYEPILFCTKDPKKYTFNSQDILIEAKTGAQRKLVDYRKDPPAVYNSKKVPGNVWDFSRVRYKMPEYCDHPTQKPEALLERIIKASSNPEDTVLDPFAGSFTTAAVCRKLKRNYIAIEYDPDYFEAGVKRISKY